MVLTKAYFIRKLIQKMYSSIVKLLMIGNRPSRNIGVIMSWTGARHPSTTVKSVELRHWCSNGVWTASKDTRERKKCKKKKKNRIASPIYNKDQKSFALGNYYDIEHQPAHKKAATFQWPTGSFRHWLFTFLSFFCLWHESNILILRYTTMSWYIVFDQYYLLGTPCWKTSQQFLWEFLSPTPSVPKSCIEFLVQLHT